MLIGVLIRKKKKEKEIWKDNVKKQGKDAHLQATVTDLE
jgi:hypothetical protein